MFAPRLVGRPTSRRRRLISAISAVLLSILLAANAVAASWTEPYPIAEGPNAFGIGIAHLGGDAAVGLYGAGQAAVNLSVRRTTDGGLTWHPPTQVASATLGGDIAGDRTAVDVVWVNQNGRVRYARSEDRGSTFKPSVALSATGTDATDVSVSRGPGGLVAVAWNGCSGGCDREFVRVRVSDDGGASFGPEKIFLSHTLDQQVDTAIGNDTIYVLSRGTFSRWW